jgi:hypothetical protein
MVIEMLYNINYRYIDGTFGSSFNAVQCDGYTEFMITLQYILDDETADKKSIDISKQVRENSERDSLDTDKYIRLAKAYKIKR